MCAQFTCNYSMKINRCVNCSFDGFHLHDSRIHDYFSSFLTEIRDDPVRGKVLPNDFHLENWNEISTLKIARPSFDEHSTDGVADWFVPRLHQTDWVDMRTNSSVNVGVINILICNQFVNRFSADFFSQSFHYSFIYCFFILKRPNLMGCV